MKIKPGIYLHSKSGAKVKVYFVAKHSESLEEMIVYEHLDDHPIGKLWVRPASMWNEEVEIDAERKPRFILQSPI